MFLIKKDGSIHCSRGDVGTFQFKMAEADANGYLKYLDTDDNIYWYDTHNNVLYDNQYEIDRNTNINTLTMQFVNFNQNDEIKFNIYELKGYTMTPLVSKTIQVAEETDSVIISLTASDTTLGEQINAPFPFWYDITLNGVNTIVGYNEYGAKEFILYPAKGVENNG